jgi:hypothetical protein
MKAKYRWILLLLLVLGFSMSTATPGFARGLYHGGFYGGYGFGPWGGYSPYFYGPYGYYGMSYPNTGEVKLETDVKDVEVFINGAYAGSTGKLKSMRLKPDVYTLEIRAPGRQTYAEKIYVVAGKTLRLRPDLRAESKP